MKIEKQVSIAVITTDCGHESIAFAKTTEDAQSRAINQSINKYDISGIANGTTGSFKRHGIHLRVVSAAFALGITLLAAPSPSYAWGDEDWGSGETVVMIDSTPDYSQRRIEARQQRLSTERAERARIMSVIRENDRRIERRKTEQALGAAGVAIADYVNGVEYNDANNETQVEW